MSNHSLCINQLVRAERAGPVFFCNPVSDLIPANVFQFFGNSSQDCKIYSNVLSGSLPGLALLLKLTAKLESFELH